MTPKIIKLEDAAIKTIHDVEDDEKDIFNDPYSHKRGFALLLNFEELVVNGYYDINFFTRVLIHEENRRLAIKYESIEKVANLVSPKINDYNLNNIIDDCGFCCLFLVDSQSRILYGKRLEVKIKRATG